MYLHQIKYFQMVATFKTRVNMEVVVRAQIPP